MKWTNVVKAVGTVMIVIGVIAAIVEAVAAAMYLHYSIQVGIITVLGFVVALAVGVLSTIVAVSGLMMFCEISQNIAAIRKAVEEQNKHKTM